jgi:iron complex outermembrane receptor protein
MKKDEQLKARGNQIYNLKRVFLVLFLILPGIILAQENDSLKSYELNQVVITGTRIAKEKGKVPASISVVGRQEIEQSGESNVLNVLNNHVPGLFLNNRNVTGFGVGPSSAGNISIRGISGVPNTRVLVLIDGQPQFMGLFGHPIGDSYMSSDVERVEVIRGPASVLYGSNAIGGAINLITRNQLKDGVSLNAKAAYGSFNTQKYMLNSGYKKGDFNVYGAINYDRTDGHRKNADDEFSNLTGFLKLGYTINPSYKISLDGNLSDSEFNDPGPVTNLFEDHYYRYKRGRAAFSLDNDYEWMEGAFRAFYNFGDHEFFDGWRSNDYNTGITFYQNLKLLPGNIITVGVDYKHFGGEGRNDNLPAPAARGLDTQHEIDEVETYLLIQQALGALTLNGGLRYTNNSLYGDANTPTIGATYAISNAATIKASASKAFRSPTIVDLYIFPPANEELQPEELWSYEVSYLQSLLNNRLSLEITGYLNDGKNMIQAVPTGQPGPPRRINTGAFSNKGVEFQTNFQVSNSFNLSANYNYMNLENPLPYAPEHELNLIGNYQWNIFSLMLGTKYVNNLYTNIESGATQSYTLLDARLSARVLKNLTVFLDGENLLDSQYQIDFNYPMPGITMMGGLHFRY